MELSEKILSSEHMYQGKIINLRKDNVELPNGKETLREVVEHPGGVGILPLDENGMVYMVRQYRHGMQEPVLEIPAGKLNYGEGALLCGKRELLEEIGAEAEVYENLGELYPTPAYCEEVISVFLAKGLRFSKQKLDDDEFLEIEKIPLKELLEMALQNELKDAKTQLAVLKAAVLEGLLQNPR